MEAAGGGAAWWTQFMQLDYLLSKTAAFLLAATLHDVLQTGIAAIFGDRTAREQGRLTFNPLAHLDPLGLAMLLFGPYGWSRKIPVDRESLGPRANVKALLVYGAGPLLHLALGVLFWWLSFMIPFAALYDWSTRVEGEYSPLQSWPAWLLGGCQSFIYWSFIVNIMLFIIHLIPLHPADLWKAAAHGGNERWRRFMSRGERWTTVLLVAILVTPIGRLLLETLFQWWSSTVMHLF